MIEITLKSITAYYFQIQCHTQDTHIYQQIRKVEILSETEDISISEAICLARENVGKRASVLVSARKTNWPDPEAQGHAASWESAPRVLSANERRSAACREARGKGERMRRKETDWMPGNHGAKLSSKAWPGRVSRSQNKYMPAKNANLEQIVYAVRFYDQHSPISSCHSLCFAKYECYSRGPSVICPFLLTPAVRHIITCSCNC